MTPQEEFAAKRGEAESLIRQHAPERLQEQLIALLRPAIALTATRTDDAQIPIGASKFPARPMFPKASSDRIGTYQPEPLMKSHRFVCCV